MDRQTFQEKFEAQLHVLGTEINRLLSHLEGAARRQAEDLPRQYAVAREKFTDLQSSSAEAWEDLKPGFERAWLELKKSFGQAASRFQKKE